MKICFRKMFWAKWKETLIQKGDTKYGSIAEKAEYNTCGTGKEETESTRRCFGIVPGWLIEEFKELFSLAWYLSVINLFSNIMGTISVTFCGHLGTAQLDGVSLAVSLLNVFGICVANGLCTACDTLFSQSFGSRNKKKVGVYLQQNDIGCDGYMLDCIVRGRKGHQKKMCKTFPEFTGAHYMRVQSVLAEYFQDEIESSDSDSESSDTGIQKVKTEYIQLQPFIGNKDSVAATTNFDDSDVNSTTTDPMTETLQRLHHVPVITETAACQREPPPSLLNRKPVLLPLPEKFPIENIAFGRHGIRMIETGVYDRAGVIDINDKLSTAIMPYGGTSPSRVLKEAVAIALINRYPNLRLGQDEATAKKSWMHRLTVRYSTQRTAIRKANQRAGIPVQVDEARVKAGKSARATNKPVKHRKKTKQQKKDTLDDEYRQAAEQKKQDLQEDHKSLPSQRNHRSIRENMEFTFKLRACEVTNQRPTAADFFRAWPFAKAHANMMADLTNLRPTFDPEVDMRRYLGGIIEQARTFAAGKPAIHPLNEALGMLAQSEHLELKVYVALLASCYLFPSNSTKPRLAHRYLVDSFPLGTPATEIGDDIGDRLQPFVVYMGEPSTASQCLVMCEKRLVSHARAVDSILEIMALHFMLDMRYNQHVGGALHFWEALLCPQPGRLYNGKITSAVAQLKRQSGSSSHC